MSTRLKIGLAIATRRMIVKRLSDALDALDRNDEEIEDLLATQFPSEEDTDLLRNGVRIVDEVIGAVLCEVWERLDPFAALPDEPIPFSIPPEKVRECFDEVRAAIAVDDRELAIAKIITERPAVASLSEEESAAFRAGALAGIDEIMQQKENQ